MKIALPARLPSLAVLLACIPLGAASCPDGGTTDPPVEDVVPAQVVITPLSDTLTWINATRQLSAQVLNRSGAPLSASVTWSSQATGVITVSSSGVATAVGVGTATVVAQASGASGSAVLVVRPRATSITKRTGDTQSATAGQLLTTALEVEVKDQGGTGVAGASLTWTVATGGGQLESSSASTDASGIGRAVWRLGSTVGSQTVQVSTGTLSAVVFTATARDAAGLTISGVSPTIFREGSAATVTGTGFSATAGQNQVSVGGLTATITAATTSSLTFTVPTSDCLPARQAELRVAVSGGAATRTVPVTPDSVLALTATNGWLAANKCIHLAAGTGSEKYLVGVTSTSETPSSLTPVQLTGAAGVNLQGAASVEPSSNLASALDARAILMGPRPPAPPPLLAWAPAPLRDAHRAFEARHRAAERLLLQQRPAPAELQALRRRAMAAPQAIPAAGDTLTLSVPGTCSSGTAVRGVVRYVGSGGLWVEDVENPTESFTAAEYKEMDDFYSQKTHAVLTKYFGNFVDLDGNGRTIILLTKEVNRKESTLGFVWGGDLYPKSACATSNEAEIFYGIVPDPDGKFGDKRTKAEVAAEYPTLVAHEITHVIQMTQIVHGSADLKSTWELEGGATLAEQLVGYSALGHGSGQDLGSSVFWSAYDAQWYRNWAVDMAVYFGFSGDTRIATAPEQCSWVGLVSEGNTGPCDNLRAAYGVPSTFLRFILDRYGPGFSGGEEALMRALTGSQRTGFANAAGTTGDSVTRLVVLFGITLWADGRVWNSLTSWNLYDVFQSFRETARLKPYTSVAAGPSLGVSVRAGSQAYLEWSPSAGHAPTSFRARTPSGGALPDHVILWILRVQ